MGAVPLYPKVDPTPKLTGWTSDPGRWHVALTASRAVHPKVDILGVWYKYRGTSLTRKRLPLGPYGRPMPRAL